MPITRVFRTFVQSERAGGLLLVACAFLSIALANSAVGAAWIAFWTQPLGPLTLQAWINDALMTLFFLLVGLELEREIYVGELSDFRAALLPFAAALGGVAVPTAIHFALNHDTPAQAGAAIPMATDIAFALAAMGLLGDRVPLALKVFITAFAVMDDLMAVLVIALAYTSNLSWIDLALAAIVFGFLLVANRMRWLMLAPYLAGGVVFWYFMLRSGVHPTVAGVLLAFAVPFEPRDPIERSPSHRLEQALHKPVAFLVLPVFALANTCVIVSSGLTSLTDSNSLGILLGLVVGKPVGIFAACTLAATLGLRKPAEVSWRDIAGAGILGGIGFTMSIFITQLAFPARSPYATSSILAIMMASLLATILGVAWLAAASRSSKAP